MNYKEVEGDLIEMAKNGEFDIIVHGCNCRNIMGAGIAAQIKKEFPEAFVADKSFEPIFMQNRLGCLSYAWVSNYPLVIVNAYTQVKLGANLDYDALRLCMRKLNMSLLDKSMKVGLPQIGAGIGGGDWKKIKQIVQEELVDLDVTIVIYDK